MKKIIYLFLMAMVMVQCSPKTGENAATGSVGNLKIGTSPDTEIDRSKAPKPGPAPKIQMGSYEKFTLENGMECIVVKNDKIPRVSFTYSLNIDPVVEGEAAGLSSIMGEMLRRGTTNRTKQQIDEEVDFIGATLSTSASSVTAAGLTKHTDKLLELMADVLVNPTFPQEELDKVKKQTISGLASEKNDPSAIARNVSSALVYGKNHPYGEITTEETVQNITSEKVQAFYRSHFKPNAGYLVVVGDIDAAAAKAKLEGYFKKWKGGNVEKRTYTMPEAPKGTNVAFVDRTGAVQSVITVTYPVDLKPGSKDAITASVANSVLGGGGFSGRLMQNLREDKGYTYGARSQLSTDPLVGQFSASASVRNEVTDSSVTEFLYEIDRMAKEKVPAEDLQKIKNMMAGSFARALERPETVANFALNISRYNLPADYYEKYLERLAAVTADDVLNVSKKYFSKDKAHVLVVGNKDAVADKLAGFAADKKVDFYDNYGNPIQEAEATPSDLTAADVVNRYIKAVGGEEALNSVEDLTQLFDMEAMGQTLNAVIKQQKNNKFKFAISMGGQVFQEQIFDGEGGVVKSMGNKQALEGEALEAMKEQAVMFPELNYGSQNYTLELKGTESINGKVAYKLEITSPNGTKSTDFFDKETGYKVRSVNTIPSPQGDVSQVTEYSDHRKVGNLVFPYKMTQSVQGQNFTLVAKEIVVNGGLGEDEFSID